jgi:hypothetical protein
MLIIAMMFLFSGCILLLTFEVRKLRHTIEGLPRPVTTDRPLTASIPIRSESKALPISSDIQEVLHGQGDLWSHHGWVREGSKAWKDAYNTPGLALRDTKGHIEVGKQ